MVLEQLMSGQDLDADAAETLMAQVVDGALTDVQIAAVLVALRMKGAQASELAGFTRVLQRHALTLKNAPDNLVDTCGTGGGINTFNLSTGAAFVAAAAGVKVAKHGNRAVTSKCGSADVLEALGVSLGLELERAQHLLETVGIVFLFAPAHHPALKAVGAARQQLGVRTVFNQLGPLANPAGAKRQLIGVYDFTLAPPMAQALSVLGAERALIVQGEDGMDEISPCAPTKVMDLRDGDIVETRLEPRQFGFEPLDLADVSAGETIEENAQLLRAALSGVDSKRAIALIPNAAAAIWLGGLTATISEAAELARQTIAEGKAIHKLDELIEATRSF